MGCPSVPKLQVNRVPVAGECIRPFGLWFDNTQGCLEGSGTTRHTIIASDLAGPLSLASMAASGSSVQTVGVSACLTSESPFWRYHLNGDLAFYKLTETVSQCDILQFDDGCTASTTPSSAFSNTGGDCAAGNSAASACGAIGGCQYLSDTGFDAWTGETVAAPTASVEFVVGGWCAAPGMTQLENAMVTRGEMFALMPNVSVSLMQNTQPHSVDPRPLANAAAAATSLVDPPFSAFFTDVSHSGAFSSSGTTWLHSWSYLDCVQDTLHAGSCDPAAAVNPNAVLNPNAQLLPTPTGATHCGDVSGVQTWSCDASSCVHSLSCTVVVTNGATLTIEAGSIVYAAEGVSLVIHPGGAIVASGTYRDPITFTANKTTAQMGADLSGHWGGLVLLGNASVVTVTDNGNVDNASSVMIPNGVGSTQQHDFGQGATSASSTSKLQFVRVWHAGGSTNENITMPALIFGAVKSTDVDVEHIEVAHAGPQGVWFYGGNVNAKYVSVIFASSAILADSGFTGMLEFAFVVPAETDTTNSSSCIDTLLPAQTGGVFRSHLCENEALMAVVGTGEGIFAPSGRTAPTVMGVTVASAFGNAPLLGLFGGTGGRFGNLVLVTSSPDVPAIKHTGCTAEVVTQRRDVADATELSALLYVSRNTIIGSTFRRSVGCVPQKEYWESVTANLCFADVIGREGCAKACAGSTSCRGFNFLPETLAPATCEIYMTNSTAAVWDHATPRTSPFGTLGTMGCHAVYSVSTRVWLFAVCLV